MVSNSKNFIVTVVIMILFNLNNGVSENQDSFTAEILFKNRTNTAYFVKCYPISLIFNANFNYSLLSTNPWENSTSNLRFDYNNGVYLLRNLPDTTRIKKSVLYVGPDKGFQTDQADDHEENYGSLGFGKYKILFATNEEMTTIIDSLTLEYDAGYGLGTLSPDVIFYINSNGRISFQWGGMVERNIYASDVNRKIECWNQYERGVRPKNLGNFVYDASDDNNYNILPQDSRKDCDILTGVPNENQVFDDNQSGILTLNMTIGKDVYTRDTLIDSPTDILVTSEAALKIGSGKTFEMVTPNSPINGYTHLTIQDSAHLTLLSGAQLIIDKPNRLTLKNKSSLKFFSNSKIIIRQGGIFCNEGAEILGSANIVFKGGSIHHVQCASLADYLVKDSVKYILDTNAVLHIPDSTTLHFTGNETSLIMRPNSKLKLGVNSKILFENGARLIANNAEFSSNDSTKKWLGISLNDLSQDTIKNCTIKNAKYGISIADKYNASESPYSTEISGCSFVNETNSACNNGIYISNSNKILIRDNTFSASIPDGYTHGIYMEYCPSGAVIICDNIIENSIYGMTIIQSSPYIARNTLNGDTYSDQGFFLDNANGTLEYNIVNDYYYAYYSYYSSPNLLRNTFNNSQDDNMYLTSYSAPVMYPLNSGGNREWFAGDNMFTGTPSNSGIYFEYDAYPVMNNGLNRFNLPSTTYFLNGQNPSELPEDFYVLQNYWGVTPQSSRFNISDATVHFSPYDSGYSAVRTADYNDLYEIGFGLYDSVSVKEDGDNSTIQDLYLLAYKKNMRKNLKTL